MLCKFQFRSSRVCGHRSIRFRNAGMVNFAFYDCVSLKNAVFAPFKPTHFEVLFPFDLLQEKHRQTLGRYPNYLEKSKQSPSVMKDTTLDD